MFAEVTGGAGSEATPTLAAAILALASLAGTALTVFWGKRSGVRRRTDDAPTPPDVLANSTRITVVEENVSRLHDAVIRLQEQTGENRHRLKRVEDRIWPTS